MHCKSLCLAKIVQLLRVRTVMFWRLALGVATAPAAFSTASPAPTPSLNAPCPRNSPALVFEALKLCWSAYTNGPQGSQTCLGPLKFHEIP